MTNDLDTRLKAARQRGITSSLPYAGAVLPDEAWALLADPRVILVDVRTTAERAWVGKVKLDGTQHVAVEWNTWPAGTPNPAFVEQLQQQVPDKEAAPVLLFLCRSGVRSRSAAKAASEAGFTHCYDILEGFEGDKDADGHRKTLGGWCKAGLPWVGG